MVAAASAAQLQATILDFQDATGNIVIGSKIWGDHCLVGPSIFVFRNFDDYKKCVGQKCDILFLNEAVNLDEKSFDTLVQGVTDSVFLNYNPTHSCWVNKRINKNNLLCTTWKDNPYLTQAQREEFEEIKRRALSQTATVFDQYNYTVFYKGEFGNLSGAVFKTVYNCKSDEFDRIPAPSNYGLDFGFVNGADKCALVESKVFNNCLYARTLIYSNNLTTDLALAERMSSVGVLSTDVIFCDYGGLGKRRIANLISAGEYTWEEPLNKGFNCCNAKKTKVLDGIQRVLEFDKIFVVEGDPLRTEMDNYTIDESSKTKGDDHAIDALRYSLSEYMQYL